MTTRETPGDRVRRVCLAKGIQPNELERLAKLTRGHGSRLLGGKRPKPSADTLVKIAKALDVSLSWLLTGEGEMDPKQALERQVADLNRRMSSLENPPASSRGHGTISSLPPRRGR